jgi:5-methylcytosine-specific restriction endonuclease McrA
VVRSTARPLIDLYKRDKGICWKCKREITLEESTRDHVVPRSLGGSNGWANLKLCCKPCNENRGNILDDDAVTVMLGADRPWKPVTRYKGEKLPVLHGNSKVRRQITKSPKVPEE